MARVRQMSAPATVAVAPGHCKMVSAQAATHSFALVEGVFPFPSLATRRLCGKLVQETDLANSYSKRERIHGQVGKVI